MTTTTTAAAAATTTIATKPGDTTTSTTAARDYQSALLATGCTNSRVGASSHWDSLSWAGVYKDMFAYCNVVKNGSPKPYQVG